MPTRDQSNEIGLTHCVKCNRATHKHKIFLQIGENGNRDQLSIGANVRMQYVDVDCMTYDKLLQQVYQLTLTLGFLLLSKYVLKCLNICFWSCFRYNKELQEKDVKNNNGIYDDGVWEASDVSTGYGTSCLMMVRMVHLITSFDCISLSCS